MSEAIVLNYIDKLYDTLSRNWLVSAWAFRGRLVLSIFLFAFSSGEISVAKGIFAPAGFNFQAPLGFLITLAVLAIQFLSLLFSASDEHEGRLRSEIIRRYRQLGYSAATDEPGVTPFLNPDVHVAALSPMFKLFRNVGPISRWDLADIVISWILVAVFFSMLYLAAQLSAEWLLLQAFCKSWYSIAGDLILFLMTIWITARSLFAMQRGVRAGPYHQSRWAKSELSAANPNFTQLRTKRRSWRFWRLRT